MSTVTTFAENQPTPVPLGNQLIKAENLLDFSATNASAADVVQCLNIPKGAVVIKQWVQVVTAEGGTATGDFGDGDDPNGYNDAVNLNTTTATSGAIFPTPGTDAYADGRLYTAADTIDLTLDHALDAAVIRVGAIYAMSEYEANE